MKKYPAAFWTIFIVFVAVLGAFSNKPKAVAGNYYGWSWFLYDYRMLNTVFPGAVWFFEYTEYSGNPIADQVCAFYSPSEFVCALYLNPALQVDFNGEYIIDYSGIAFQFE